MPPQTSQQMPPTTSGPINAVPCPHCGHKLSFRGQEDLLHAGMRFTCDKCKRPVDLVSAAPVMIVTVRKPPTAAPRAQTAIRRR